MNNRMLRLALVFGLYSGVSAQSWFPQTSGTFQPLRSVHFPSPEIGFAVGFTGTIMKTTNGGNTWSVEYDTSYVSLQSVYCITTTTCLAVGDYGKVLKTTNGGTTWSSQPSGKTTTLYTVRCPTATICYASTQSPTGTNNSVIKSTNAGTSWTAQGTGSFKWPYFAVGCFDAENCYLGGEARTVHRTTNGSTWTEQVTPPAPPGTANQNLPVLSIACLNPTTCIIVGGSGMMAKTTDGMATWTNLATTTSSRETLRSIYFVDANTGYIAGDSGLVLRTTNGGSAWTRMTTGAKLGLYGITFPDAGTGYAVGENGLIYKYGTPTTVLSSGPLNGYRVEEPRDGELRFYLPGSARVALRISDAGGKTLFRLDKAAHPGENLWTLPAAARGGFLDFRAGPLRRGFRIDPQSR